MKFNVITLFPELINHYSQQALLGKAQNKNIIQLNLFNLREFSDNKYQSVDETPFGGFDGMLIRPDILQSAIDRITQIEKGPLFKIYFSPQGRKLDHNLLLELNTYQNFILISGRYAGVDQRWIRHSVDLEISIGDFVLNGGELPILTFIESMTRLQNGVVGDKESILNDSFYNGMLEPPQFTKPANWKVSTHQEWQVPSVLISGHHKRIQNFHFWSTLLTTWFKRNDLFKKNSNQFILQKYTDEYLLFYIDFADWLEHLISDQFILLYYLNMSTTEFNFFIEIILQIFDEITINPLMLSNQLRKKTIVEINELKERIKIKMELINVSNK